jgi:Ca2+-binding EF-hand superfamily protein
LRLKTTPQYALDELADVSKTVTMKFILSAAAAIFASVALTVQAAPRVAMMDFSVDDNSYRSAQAAADFSSLLQAKLASEPDVEWVERAQLDKARQELELSVAELINSSSSIQRGKWVKADWMVTGQFSLDDRNQRTLFIKITDLQHADVLASRTIAFPGVASRLLVETNQAGIAADTLRQLLSEAHLRQQQMEGKFVVAPLFLADTTSFGAGFGFSDGGARLESEFNEVLERMVATNTNVQLIRFPKAYRSTDESEMVLDGLVEADRNAWQQTADLYVWGTYAVVRQTTPGKMDEKLEISLQLWDGVSAPTTLKDALPADARPEQIEASLERLTGQVMSHAHRHMAKTDSESIRKNIAQSLVETYDRMTLGFHHREELGLGSPEKFLQAVHMLETACFFDPDNANARMLYITCRWGWWMDFGFKVKNEFWSKWRRSQALAGYVNRFGLKPVTEELPFPYQQQGGIPAMYTQSIRDVLEMFPQWHSTEEMELEDKWQQEGVHTDLMEAEYHGFPNEMPHELAMKWKTETEAEGERRNKMVEEFSRSTASVTNQPGPPPANQSRAISMSTQAGSHPIPQFERKTSVPPVILSSPEMVPTPDWLTKTVFQSYTLFRLGFPGSLSPEVKPEYHEIQFPPQFEVQSVLHMGFLQDKLLILAMDQRSAQSSDSHPDIASEMLDERNRLWCLDAGAASPILYEPDLLPKGVRGFLEQSNRLWVAGPTTGCLDLKEHVFHKSGLDEGFTLREGFGIGMAGGNIFVCSDSLGAMKYDPQSNHWKELAKPGGYMQWSGGKPFFLSGNNHWLAVGQEENSVAIYDLTANAGQTLQDPLWFQGCVATDSGFWLGGSGGLQFYDPKTGSSRRWSGPSTVEGTFTGQICPMFLGNGTMRKADLETTENKAKRIIKELEANRAKVHAAKAQNKTVADPLALNYRVPGEVTALARDGDYLWLGVANFFGNQLLLLHWPSESVIASFVMPVRDKISSLAVSKDSVWVGTAYGDHKLLQIPKDSFLSVPKNQWVNLAISPEERERLISSMSVRDQAMYAFYAGDDARVVTLLENLEPHKATLEEMFLLMFSHDTLGVDNPDLMREWAGHISSRVPDSPWAETADGALAENEKKREATRHEAMLLAKYDLNHNGVLDPDEKLAMERDPEYQHEKQSRDASALDEQLKEIMKRFDIDGDGKLNQHELEMLTARVSIYSQAAPEVLAGHKILVAPLLSKQFPSVPAILEKYDADHDGKIDLKELKALARDVQKNP